ncbi:unnamed protein product [Spirodela intermedia]|uniref:Uncharacterized protein n=1 Tax=Spirodela intermedia TaxID=51605 RepID=A0A7I8IUR9_SPIIN|nr:unnamed protein product [Spirodela intermedia]CAA6661735.1 unnamed protein product [Spirodela intermedia]
MNTCPIKAVQDRRTMGLLLAELIPSSSTLDIHRRRRLLPRRSFSTATAAFNSGATSGPGLAGDPRQGFDPSGVPQDRVSFVRALGRIARSECWLSGRILHGIVVKSGRSSDRFIAASLLDMYAKCGDLESAGVVFDRLDDRDAVAWNSFTSGYAANGFPARALDLFLRLAATGEPPPTGHTISIAIGGKQLHAVAVKSDFLQDTAVGNSLVTMYGKCDMIIEAEVLFDEMPHRNLVSWNAMAGAFYRNGSFERALDQVSRMRLSEVEAEGRAWVTSLACCGSLRRLRWGKGIHALAIKGGFSSNAFVSSAVVGMYSGCAEMADAEKKLEDDSAVPSWNALLSGYVRVRQNVAEALSLDHFTFSTVLKACSSLPSLAAGEQIHAQIVKSGRGGGHGASNPHVGSSLIEMYSRCGCLAEAEKVFAAMEEKDTVVWNSMLGGYAQGGFGEKAILLYDRMREEGVVKPTGPTLLAVLSACSHSGLVQQGRRIFDSMAKGNQGIEPEEPHFACMVDLLSRRGLLRQAEDFIARLPTKATSPTPSSIWRPLLAAARSYGDLTTAEQVAGRMLEMNPEDPTVYVTLANMYAADGRRDEAANQRRAMSEKALKKEPGYSWIEVDSRVHMFFCNDKRSEMTSEIYEKLRELAGEIRRRGGGSTAEEDRGCITVRG